LLALLAWPPGAAAQRDQFFDALLPLYHALAGAYGDEGPQLIAGVETLASTLSRWDAALAAADREWRGRLRVGDTQTRLQAHVVLASLYAERSRFGEALREIDAAIGIDAARAPLHRFKALLHRASGRPAEAADAFRAAWLVDPADPQNAYQLVVQRAAATTPAELRRALDTLASLERELVRGGRPGVDAPFLTLNAIDDDVGEGLAFAPAAYARAISLLLGGQFAAGMTAVRSAVALDPLVADPAAGSDAMRRGIAALRQGAVAEAISLLESVLVSQPASSEAHRALGTAYAITGEVARSIAHLRDAVRLQPTDERSWLALARGLDANGELQPALEALREAVTHLPESGALRWVLSVTSAKRHLTDDLDLALVADVERLVLLAGRGDLYGRIAGLAQRHLEYERALALLEARVGLTPNNAAAHRALGGAYVELGREDAGYAELAIALLIRPAEAETLTALARLHLTAGRYAEAVDAAARAVALAPADAQAVHALGDALVRAGRPEEAEPHLAASARLQARAVEEQRRLRTAGMLAAQAEIRMRERQYAAASELWAEVLELQGSNAAEHLRLAAALAGAGRQQEALGQIERAIARGAGPEAHRRLAEVYRALGRTEAADDAQRTYVQRRLQQLREEAGVQAPGSP
jgi:tetratricopeptide (TPR) repeat protein